MAPGTCQLLRVTARMDSQAHDTKTSLHLLLVAQRPIALYLITSVGNHPRERSGACFKVFYLCGFFKKKLSWGKSNQVLILWVGFKKVTGKSQFSIVAMFMRSHEASSFPFTNLITVASESRGFKGATCTHS